MKQNGKDCPSHAFPQPLTVHSLLLGISARLQVLENNIINANTKLDELGSRINNLPSSNEFQNTIDNLKESIKGFAGAVLLEVFGKRDSKD